MSTKICPNCNAEVPGVAHLCKHCFHDFNVVLPKRKSPLFPVLLFLLGAALVSAGAYGYIIDQNRVYTISLDEETQSIVFTTVYADGPQADRVYWKDVSNVEYVMNTSPRPFQVDVVTVKGERFVYKQGDEPLDFAAQTLADTIKRPMVTRDESGVSDGVNKR